MKIKNNYHTHTNYCNHATLTIEQNVKIAIKKGLDTIGISEHIAPPSGLGRFRIRDARTQEKYILEVNKIKEKYKDKIKVLCGFESEYCHPRENGKFMHDYLKGIKSDSRVDYIILGHHNIDPENHYGSFEVITKTIIKKYVKDFIAAIKTGVFLYMAHPSVFANKMQEWTPVVEKYIKKMCKFAAKQNVIFGINVNGIYKGKIKYKDMERYSYPHINFFKIAAKYGVKCIVELDAHDENVWEDKFAKEAFKFAKEAKVILLDKLI